MSKSTSVSIVASLVFLFVACGGGSEPAAPAGSVSAKPPAAAEDASPPAAPVKTSGMQKISDMLEAWNELYNQSEAAVNAYEGMPIMGLVTPPTTFIATVQFDLMNPDNKDGRFEGTMMLAGYQGFVEKSGGNISFGWDDTLKKDGFGPGAKAGDRMVGRGSLDLKAEYYISETFTERAGNKIARTHHEFKRLGDGSMICVAQTGQAFDMRGDAANRDDVVFIHNGPGRLDFVVAKAASGPGFKSISFKEAGDLTKAQALDLFRASGYSIDATGGIKDGTLFVEK